FCLPTLCLHDALPISRAARNGSMRRRRKILIGPDSHRNGMLITSLSWILLSDNLISMSTELSQRHLRTFIAVSSEESFTRDEGRSEEHTSELQSRFDL